MAKQTTRKRASSASSASKRSAKRSSPKRVSSKRELIKPNGDSRYIRRNAQGQIKESDDLGQSLKQDRARKAKAKVKPGQGDRGDR